MQQSPQTFSVKICMFSRLHPPAGHSTQTRTQSGQLCRPPHPAQVRPASWPRSHKWSNKQHWCLASSVDAVSKGVPGAVQTAGPFLLLSSTYCGVFIHPAVLRQVGSLFPASQGHTAVKALSCMGTRALPSQAAAQSEGPTPGSGDAAARSSGAASVLRLLPSL